MLFIESPWFTRRLAELEINEGLKVLQAIQGDLLANPFRGDVVPGLAGVRKARVGSPGREGGKRGGYRYFYLYIQLKDHIHLLTILSKRQQSDLNTQEMTLLRKLALAVRGQEGRETWHEGKGGFFKK